MRTILMSLLAALTVGLFGTTAATAAGKWTCEGPEYVCGSSSNSVTATRKPDAAERSTPRAAKVAKRAKAANTQTASRSSDDDRPARRASRQARASSESDSSGYTLSGKASYYWQPQALASGGRFNPDAYTAAHKTLPFGTRVRVTNQYNGQSVTVVINDRGPYIAGRIIDLSRAAAGAIDMKGRGVVPVSVQVLGRG